MLDKVTSQSARYQGLVRRAAVYQAWVDSHQLGLPDALAMLDADARQVNVVFDPAAFVSAPLPAPHADTRRTSRAGDATRTAPVVRLEVGTRRPH